MSDNPNSFVRLPPQTGANADVDHFTITINPDDPAHIEVIARQRAITEGYHPDEMVQFDDLAPCRAWEIFVDDVQNVMRAAIVALKEMKR